MADEAKDVKPAADPSPATTEPTAEKPTATQDGQEKAVPYERFREKNEEAKTLKEQLGRAVKGLKALLEERETFIQEKQAADNPDEPTETKVLRAMEKRIEQAEARVKGGEDQLAAREAKAEILRRYPDLAGSRVAMRALLASANDDFEAASTVAEKVEAILKAAGELDVEHKKEIGAAVEKMKNPPAAPPALGGTKSPARQAVPQKTVKELEKLSDEERRTGLSQKFLDYVASRPAEED